MNYKTEKTEKETQEGLVRSDQERTVSVLKEERET